MILVLRAHATRELLSIASERALRGCRVSFDPAGRRVGCSTLYSLFCSRAPRSVLLAAGCWGQVLRPYSQPSSHARHLAPLVTMGRRIDRAAKSASGPGNTPRQRPHRLSRLAGTGTSRQRLRRTVSQNSEHRHAGGTLPTKSAPPMMLPINAGIILFQM